MRGSSRVHCCKVIVSTHSLVLDTDTALSCKHWSPVTFIVPCYYSTQHSLVHSQRQIRCAVAHTWSHSTLVSPQTPSPHKRSTQAMNFHAALLHASAQSLASQCCSTLCQFVQQICDQGQPKIQQSRRTLGCTQNFTAGLTSTGGRAGRQNCTWTSWSSLLLSGNVMVRLPLAAS